MLDQSFGYSGSSVIYAVTFLTKDNEQLGYMIYDDYIPLPSEGETIELTELRYGDSDSDSEPQDLVDGTQVVVDRSVTYQYILAGESAEQERSEGEEQEAALVVIANITLSTQ